MTNKFEGKSAKEIAEYYCNARDISFKDEIKTIDSLDAARRSGVIDALEKETVKVLKEDARDFKLFGASPYANMERSVDFLEGFLDGFMTDEDMTDEDREKLVKARKELTDEVEKENAESLAGYQDMCHLIHYLAEAKGDTAHPAIKEAAKTLSALSDAGYNSLDKLRGALTKAYNAAAVPASKTPNPFKKGPQGPKI